MSPTDLPGPVCAREDVGPHQAGQRTSRQGYHWTVLPRHGRRPLAVQGRILLRASNRCTRLPAWSEIVMHETREGRLVVALQHRFPDEAAANWQDAWLHDDVSTLWAAILDHDPITAIRLGKMVMSPCGPLPQNHARCSEMAGIASFRAAWFGLIGAVFWPACVMK